MVPRYRFADDKIVHERNQGNDYTLPSRLVICPRCNGKGEHDVFNGLSPDDFAEDPDLLGDYCAGQYNVVCTTCHGRNVVEEVDISSMNEYQRTAYEQWCQTQQLIMAERKLQELGI